MDKKIEKNSPTPPGERFIKLYNKKKILIVPLGLTPNLAKRIQRKLNVKLIINPFARGIFTPQSLSKLLASHHAETTSPLEQSKFDICSITRSTSSIAVEVESYESINIKCASASTEELKNYLSASHSYYSLDKQTGALYMNGNWHQKAAEKQPTRLFSPEENLSKLIETTNKRITRLSNLCKKAEIVLFVYNTPPKLDNLLLNGVQQNITETVELQESVTNKFGPKAKLVTFQDINNPRKILKLYRESKPGKASTA